MLGRIWEAAERIIRSIPAGSRTFGDAFNVLKGRPLAVAARNVATSLQHALLHGADDQRAGQAVVQGAVA